MNTFSNYTEVNSLLRSQSRYIHIFVTKSNTKKFVEFKPDLIIRIKIEFDKDPMLFSHTRD